MKFVKRLCSCVWAALLLAAWAAPARAEEAALPEVPAVTVSGVRVTDGKHFELGLRISARQFQTAGVVLRYNAAQLVPVSWSDGADTALPSASSWRAAAPAALHTVGLDALAGKPALAYRDSAEGAQDAYLYLGADALTYTALDDAQVATVRFRYAEGVKPEDVKLPTAEAAADGGPYTVELAPASNAADAIPGAPALVTASADLVYRPETVAFTLADGPSIGGGSASVTAGDYAITFFDWDGRLLDAIAAPKDAAAAVAAYLEANPDLLTEKPGYEFDHWLRVVPQGDALVTKNGALTSSADGLPADHADIADFSDLSAYGGSGVCVQAAYRATDAVNGGHGKDQSATQNYGLYAFSAPEFLQYGTADANNGQYAVRYTVRRGDGLRADAPVVYAQVFVGEGDAMKSVTSRIDLVNTDETSFEIVVPRAVTQVACKVLDAYGRAVWIDGTVRSAEPIAAHDEIIREGAFSLLAAETKKAKENGGNWDGAVNARCFADAGFGGVQDETTAQEARNLLVAADLGGYTRADLEAALDAYVTK